MGALCCNNSSDVDQMFTPPESKTWDGDNKKCEQFLVEQLEKNTKFERLTYKRFLSAYKRYTAGESRVSTKVLAVVFKELDLNTKMLDEDKDNAKSLARRMLFHEKMFNNTSGYFDYQLL